MPERRREIAELVGYVRDRYDVIVQGPWGSGVSLLMDRAEAELESIGYSVLRVPASENLVHIQFGALRFAVGEVFRAPGDLSMVVDRFCLYISDLARPVLVIDNIDQLDAHSVQAIRQAARRSRCQIVASVSLPGAKIAEGVLRWPLGTLRLSRLSFSQVDELISSRTQYRVSAELARRIYIESGGCVEVASGLFDIATRSGKAVLEGETWVLRSQDVWNEALSALLSPVLGALPEEAAGLLREVSRSRWPVSVAEAGPDRAAALSLLERLGFVVTWEEGGEELMSVAPPVVRHYFEHLYGSDYHGREKQDPWDWGENIVPDAVLASSFDEAAKRAAVAARQLFLRSGSLADAVEYIRSLWSFGGNADEVEALMSQWSHIRAPKTYDEASLVVLRAQWTAYYVGDAQSAINQLADAMNCDEIIAVEIAVYKLAFEASFHGMPHDVETRVSTMLGGLDNHPRGPLLAEILSYLMVVAGRPDCAINMMPPKASDIGIGEELRVISYGLSLLLLGDMDRLIPYLREKYEQAVRQLNCDALYATTYVATLAFGFLGFWQEARSLLDNINSIGRPSLLMFPIARAIQGIDAFFAAAGGRTSRAQVVVKAAVSSERPSPLVGAQGALPELLKIGIQGNPGLVEVLSRSARSCIDAGYLYAATFTAIMAAAYEASSEQLHILEAAMTDELKPSLASFISLVRAVESDSIDAAASVISGFGRNSFVFMAYLVLFRKGRLSEQSDSEKWRELAETFRKNVDLRPIDTIAPTGGRGELLSAREREVAALATSLTNQEIALRLGVSKRTVDHHISNALRKTGVSNRRALSSLISDTANPYEK